MLFLPLLTAGSEKEMSPVVVRGRISRGLAKVFNSLKAITRFFEQLSPHPRFKILIRRVDTSSRQFEIGDAERMTVLPFEDELPVGSQRNGDNPGRKLINIIRRNDLPLPGLTGIAPKRK